MYNLRGSSLIFKLISNELTLEFKMLNDPIATIAIDQNEMMRKLDILKCI